MDPVLTRYIREPNGHTLAFYEQHGGYQALKKAIGMAPDAVIEAVKASGLRGRGGAGFPTGMKWQFVDKKSPRPKYICCNADESEPGTFKDHVLMERNPHLLFEGCLIGCHAIGAKVAYIYIRGEFYHVQLVLEAELAKARAAGYVGKNIMGTGFDCEIHIHRGAGAYEAGEETALIESLEGKRAQPRIKPPFPAVEGLWGCPTAVNNVETLCNVPFIIERGAEWFTAIGPEKNTGPKLFCISGHVQKPGTFEAAMDVSLRDLIYDPKFAGGIRGGHTLKAVIPGGSSVPVLLPHQLDIPASYDGIAKAGSLLGSAGCIVMDETTCMVWAAQNLLYFYKARILRQVHAVPRGRDWLHACSARSNGERASGATSTCWSSVANNIMARRFARSATRKQPPCCRPSRCSRDEYEAHIREGRCTVPAPWRSTQRVHVGAH
jgi:NADH-quinone oxidoreductase subunit F